MKKFFFALALIGLGTSVFVIFETFAEIASLVKSPTESEIALMEEGYYAHQYAVLPFGDKHFFHKTDNPMHLAEVASGRCLMYATYPIMEGESVDVTMKFPNDLIWPGIYDNSTFFLTKGGYHGYADESGNTITKNTEVVWERIIPIVDSEFITINFELKDEIGSLIVNSTALPDLQSEKNLSDDCPSVIPKMEYDYYDRVFPINTQRMLAEIRGFPPDTFICEGNLIGAIKTTDDEKAVCVKSDTKTKLIERGWAQVF